MSTFVAGVKREFWEHKSTVLWLPLGWSVFLLGCFIIFAITVMKADQLNWSMDQEPISLGGVSVTLDLSSNAESIDNDQYLDVFDEYSERDRVDDMAMDGDTESLEEAFKKGAIPFLSKAIHATFYTIAWFVALFYLLSCLYDDRKDKSILFWKSLPVSETVNVFAKLFFGLIMINVVAMLFSWGVQILISLGIEIIVGDIVRAVPDLTLGAFSFGTMISDGILAIIVGLLWGLPIFAYIVFISALAKSSPFALAVVPILVIATLEFWIFRSTVLTDWIFQYIPMQAFFSGSEDNIFVNVMNHATPLAIGVVLAVAFIMASIWLRNYRFEM